MVETRSLACVFRLGGVIVRPADWFLVSLQPFSHAAPWQRGNVSRPGEAGEVESRERQGEGLSLSFHDVCFSRVGFIAVLPFHAFRDSGTALARFIFGVVTVFRVNAYTRVFHSAERLARAQPVRAFNVGGKVARTPLSADCLCLVPGEFHNIYLSECFVSWWLGSLPATLSRFCGGAGKGRAGSGTKSGPSRFALGTLLRCSLGGVLPQLHSNQCR